MPEKCNYCGKIFKQFKQVECTVKTTIDKKEISVDVIALVCPFCEAHCYEVLAD